MRAPPGRSIRSRGGMATLVAALVRVLADDPRAELLTSTDVQTDSARRRRVCKSATGARTHGPFAAVVEAAPAHAAAGHLDALDPGLGDGSGRFLSPRWS